MEKMNKAWICSSPGIENFSLQTIPIAPLPNETSVLVKILAAGLNPVDYKKLDWNFLSFPCFTGLDSCGIIESKGSQVSDHYKIGSIVVYHDSLFSKNNHGFSQYSIIESKYLCVVPEEIISKSENKRQLAVELAALPTVALTAYQAIFIKLKLFEEISEYNVHSIRSIVVTACLGGVGMCCLQYLRLYVEKTKRKDLKIIGICSKNNIESAKELGCTDVVDYQNEDISKKIQEITDGIGTDIWIDLVGKESSSLGLINLAFGGQLVIVVESPEFNSQLQFSKAVSIQYVALGFVFSGNDEENKMEIPKMLEKVVDFYGKKVLKPKVKTIKLEEVKDALKELKNRHVVGKIVMENEY